MKSIYKEYSAVKAKMEKLKEHEDQLKALILKDMGKMEVEKQSFKWGTFTHARRANWMYSENIRKIEERLKKVKAREVEKGIATATYTDYILFTPSK